VLIRDCLQKAPVTVPPQCSLREAARLMSAHDVGAVIVMSGDRLVGIVTDRDIAVRGVGAGLAPTDPVGTVMTESPETIEGSADVFDAYRILKDGKVRRLPVMEDEELAGMITMDDLLMGLVLELAAVTSPVAREVMYPQRLS